MPARYAGRCPEPPWWSHVGSDPCRHHGCRVRRHRPDRAGGGEAVTAENLVGLIVAAALVGYLVLALIHPEKF
ncbi:hypothetical protein KCH_36560 [Kitasatospora cheerisanensis KCTC 2395]|uniref:ATPase n=1 Tax=Kitasatospora cheerisanensis KCTC 2395 TaxID=1348663 RepID=A0A066YX53_9ACTN|nr:hypothetical protein KCH_36560 [Kitasatospora cheerisanensis KCTC 2395]